MHSFLVLENPDQEPDERERIVSLGCCPCVFPWSPRCGRPSGLWVCPIDLLVYVQLFIHNSQVLPHRTAFSVFFSQSVFTSGTTSTQVQHLHLGLLNLLRFLWAPFSSLSRPFWMSSILLLCELQHSAWSHLQTCWGCAWSSLCIIGLGIEEHQPQDSWGIPCITSLHLDMNDMNHWPQLCLDPSNQFLIPWMTVWLLISLISQIVLNSTSLMVSLSTSSLICSRFSNWP